MEDKNNYYDNVGLLTTKGVMKTKLNKRQLFPTIVTTGDGTKFLSDDGDYKEVSSGGDDGTSTITLSDATNSTSSVTAASSKAVKTAYDKAVSADTKATTATTTANEAKTAANTASTTAGEAKTAATNAATLAGEAKTEAEAASAAVTAVEAIANTAKTTADTAKSTATTASTTAGTAVTTADDAKTAATSATTIANEAKTTATNATTVANEAKTASTTATSTANTAKSTADTTKATVDKLLKAEQLSPAAEIELNCTWGTKKIYRQHFTGSIDATDTETDTVIKASLGAKLIVAVYGGRTDVVTPIGTLSDTGAILTIKMSGDDLVAVASVGTGGEPTTFTYDITVDYTKT